MLPEFVSDMQDLSTSMWKNNGKLMENSEVDLHGVDVQRSEMFRVYAAINPACFFS